MRLSRHVWRKAARLSSVAGVLHGPRENAWWTIGWRSTGYPPGAAPDLACSGSGASACGSRGMFGTKDCPPSSTATGNAPGRMWPEDRTNG